MRAVARRTGDPVAHDQRRGGYGDIDVKDGAPSDCINEPAAQGRTQGRGYRAGRCPGADGLSPLVPGIGRSDQRQAGRNEKCGGYTLDHPRPDQRDGRLRETACDRGQCEPHKSDEENPALTEPVPHGSAQQDETGEHEHVAVDDPLGRGEPGAEVFLDSGESHVDDRAIDKAQTRPQNGGRQHPSDVSRCRFAFVGVGHGASFRQRQSASRAIPALEATME